MVHARKTASEPEPTFETIAVIGGGAWGTALALTAARAGRQVRLWAREATVVEAINTARENPTFLPDVAFDVPLTASVALDDVCAGADCVLFVIPSQFVRTVARQVQAVLAAGVPVVVCAKGIESETGLLMTQVLEEEMPGRPLGVLSGPTFAQELAKGLPTAATIAFDEAAGGEAPALALAKALATPFFRPYVSTDVIGVEIGGALKNVIAIACGIATGVGFGANARAALITRGLEEMKRLGEAVGGRRETVAGLAGVGDLTLTCSSEQSRNFSYGLALGRGEDMASFFGGRPVVVEGAINAITVTDLARKLEVELPICEAVRGVIKEDKPIGEVIGNLLGRPLKAEKPVK